MKWTSVRLSQDLFEKIEKNLTDLDATSVSEVARRVLVDYMKKVPKEGSI